MSVLGVPAGVDTDRLHPKVQSLFSRPQWRQRTPEWYAIRRDLLTASDAAAALGIAPYPSFRGDPRAECLKKKLDNAPIRGMFLVHGVAYESEACEAVSRALGETCHEFGLLRHPEHPWLAASPDGVTEHGHCLEIKAPMKRVIVPGKVPGHYWPQVQVQMEVCDLDSCVFAEYKPAGFTIDGAPFLNITIVERDREWFADALPKLKAFWDEYMALKKTHVPPAPPPDLCDIVEGLYPPDGEYPSYALPDAPDACDDAPPAKRRAVACDIDECMFL